VDLLAITSTWQLRCRPALYIYSYWFPFELCTVIYTVLYLCACKLVVSRVRYFSVFGVLRASHVPIPANTGAVLSRSVALYAVSSAHTNPTRPKPAPCLSSVSFASSPLHLLALSPCAHLSFHPVPASLHFLPFLQPPVLPSPYLRDASVKVPVRVHLAHRHTTFFFFFLTRLCVPAHSRRCRVCEDCRGVGVREGSCRRGRTRVCQGVQELWYLDSMPSLFFRVKKCGY